MSDRGTEPFDPGGPEPTYDWDFEEEPRGGRPKVLWGRVIALSVVLIFAFWLGRSSAGDGGDADTVSQAKYDQAIAERDEAREELARVLDEQAAEPSPSASATPDDGAVVEGETWIVKRGDTLRGVAERFYGDASLDDCIQEANGIEDPGQLSVGMELTVPPEEECT